MKIRRERTHHCGLSNIDYRRLNDRSAHLKYINDMKYTNFGLMGRKKLPYEFQSFDFGNEESLLVHSGFKAPEPSNPKLTDIKELYVKHKKPFLLPSVIKQPYSSQLEDYVWSEKVFTGEDIKQNNWYKTKAPKSDITQSQDFESFKKIRNIF